MAQFGNLTLYALVLLATWSAVLALVGVRRRARALIHAARFALYAAAAISSLALVVLTYAFVTSDFSLSYVYSYSDRAMPLFYKLTAVWGGQEGSLLFWAWLLATLSAWVVHANRQRLREMLPYLIIVLMIVLDFFAVLLLLAANPFEAFLVEVPAAGRGLKPLLQNVYMVTHPPALYLGYVGMVIPFALALSSLLAGRRDERWLVAARPWALAAWYLLTLGLVLGMLWAYEELGWGGYWAWDPVENAGLIPWLTCTAYLHAVMIQERRQLLKLWNIVLAVLSFELTIFGTFLTRSGWIQSVHAFAQSVIGWYFLGFMLLVAAVTTGLLIWRRPLLRSHERFESMLSREFLIVINTGVLLAASCLVLVLTVFPTLAQLAGDTLTINAQAFNRWMAPLGLALLVLKGTGPMIGWRKAGWRALRRLFAWPAAAAGGAGLVLFALGLRRPLALLTMVLCAFVLVTVLQELLRSVASLPALLRLLKRNRRRYGAHLVHCGVVLMYLGFAGEAYKAERELSLHQGERATVGDYTLRYDGIQSDSDSSKQMVTATLSVYRGGELLGVVHPARWVYFKHEDEPTSEVDIRRSAREDLFVALADYDGATNAATFKVIINPLVSWIWLGFLLLSLGALVAMRSPVPQAAAEQPSPEEAGAAR